MAEKRKSFLNRLHKEYVRETCYDEMRERGHAGLGKCGGLTGGDRYTDYLNYYCVSCPYLDLSYISCKEDDCRCPKCGKVDFSKPNYCSMCGYALRKKME